MTHSIRGSDVSPTKHPTCPTCGSDRPFYGGTAGFICCEYKIMTRAGGWFDEQGRHVLDDRLAGGKRRVDVVATA